MSIFLDYFSSWLSAVLHYGTESAVAKRGLNLLLLIEVEGLAIWTVTRRSSPTVKEGSGDVGLLQRVAMPWLH